MNRKEMKEIANRLAKLERECQKGNNIDENMLEMTQLVSSLSFEDLMRLDEYITNKNFLTK